MRTAAVSQVRQEQSASELRELSLKCIPHHAPHSKKQDFLHAIREWSNARRQDSKARERTSSSQSVSPIWLSAADNPEQSAILQINIKKAQSLLQGFGLFYCLKYENLLCRTMQSALARSQQLAQYSLV